MDYARMDDGRRRLELPQHPTLVVSFPSAGRRLPTKSHYEYTALIRTLCWSTRN